MATILVVDDELGIRDLLFEILNDEGHQVELAENATQARAYRNQHRPDLVLLDIWMPDTDGVSLLKEWATTGLLTMPVIMMSGHATIETAVQATRIGAHSFLEKPITLQKLLTAVEQGLQRPTTGAKSAPGLGKPVSKAPPLPLPPSSPVQSLGTLGAFTPAAAPATSFVSSPPSPAPQHAAGASMAAALPVDLTPPVGAPVQPFGLNMPLREARDAFEKSYFQYHLHHEGGSMTRVAERTGLERTHLYRKLKQLGIDLIKNKKGL